MARPHSRGAGVLRAKQPLYKSRRSDFVGSFGLKLGVESQSYHQAWIVIAKFDFSIVLLDNCRDEA